MSNLLMISSTNILSIFYFFILDFSTNLNDCPIKYRTSCMNLLILWWSMKFHFYCKYLNIALKNMRLVFLGNLLSNYDILRLRLCWFIILSKFQSPKNNDFIMFSMISGLSLALTNIVCILLSVSSMVSGAKYNNFYWFLWFFIKVVAP